ncbi:TM2 domain-containing protein [Chloracidobacterium thermophilum]|nr:TM2 domain-containing protein [Chloracidobacterium thermophilum]
MATLPGSFILTTPYGQPSQSPYQQPSYPPPMPPMPGGQLPGAEKRMQAALLAIFLGGFGAHKFLLGYQQEGLIMAAGTVGGFILSIVIGLVTCGIGFVLLIIPFAVSVIGLIEGVMYLTKSDEEFVRTYVQGRRPWF